MFLIADPLAKHFQRLDVCQVSETCDVLAVVEELIPLDYSSYL